MSVIKKISLRNFRNLKNTEIEFHPDLNFIYGDNGAGKTNFLESIYFACSAVSHKKTKTADMINFEKDFASIQLNFEKKSISHQIKAACSRQGKNFFLDNNKISSLKEIIGKVNIVTFSPEDTYIASGPPSERRKFINILLSQTDINYFLMIKKYKQILLQRNVCLKKKIKDPSYFGVLTDSLIDLSQKIRQKRSDLIKELLPLIESYMHKISRSLEKVDLKMAMSRKKDYSLSKKSIIEEFKHVENKEQKYAQTLFGAHRDDLFFNINDKDLKTYASRGQCRSVSLALKFGAADYIKQMTGDHAVFLLDDIHSELDNQRISMLFDIYKNKNQIFLSSPYFEKQLSNHKKFIFNIKNGIIKNNDI